MLLNSTVFNSGSSGGQRKLFETMKTDLSECRLGQISKSSLIQRRLRKLPVKAPPTSKNIQLKESKVNIRKRNMKKVLQKAMIGGYLSGRVSNGYFRVVL